MARRSCMLVLCRNTAANFSPETKRLVYSLSNGRCNNPSCRRMTAKIPTSHRPEVAHIRAASLLGPRYDPAMSNAERKSITNCLLLCHECHEMVDKDTQSYTTQVLCHWRPLLSAPLQEEEDALDASW